MRNLNMSQFLRYSGHFYTQHEVPQTKSILK